jgi:hypothetical protein
MCEGTPTVVSAMFGVAVLLGGGYVAVRQWKKWQKARRSLSDGSLEENIPLCEGHNDGASLDGTGTSSISRTSSMVTVATQFSASDESFECLVTSPSVVSGDGARNSPPPPRRGWLGLW